MDVIKLLAATPRAKLAPIVDATVGELFGPKHVLSVPASLPAVASFAVMHNAGMSGVAIVSDDQTTSKPSHSPSHTPPPPQSPPRLVGYLSLGDLSWCLSDGGGGEGGLDRLLLPSLSLAEQRRPPPTAAAGAPAATAVTMGTSLWDVMGALAASGSHRAFVVDGCGAPVSVVTLTDIVRLFAVDPEDDPEGWCTW